MRCPKYRPSERVLNRWISPYSREFLWAYKSEKSECSHTFHTFLPDKGLLMLVCAQHCVAKKWEAVPVDNMHVLVVEVLEIDLHHRGLKKDPPAPAA
jgi:hypothetical protein